MNREHCYPTCAPCGILCTAGQAGVPRATTSPTEKLCVGRDVPPLHHSYRHPLLASLKHVQPLCSPKTPRGGAEG